MAKITITIEDVEGDSDAVVLDMRADPPGEQDQGSMAQEMAMAFLEMVGGYADSIHSIDELGSTGEDVFPSKKGNGTTH